MVDYYGTLKKSWWWSWQMKNALLSDWDQRLRFPRQRFPSTITVSCELLFPGPERGQHSTLQPGLPATDWACLRWVGHIAFPPLSRATFNPCLWSSCNWVGHIAVRWRPITSRVSKPNLAWSRIAWSATAHAPLDRLISVWWDFVQNLYIGHVITL